ncbi:MAG: flotillin family protein [Bacteroidetes bacterium]|nr:flotillin family protein [Bacteroidota bacterium]
MFSLTVIVVFIVVIFVTILALFSRYKRCPSDRILVVYGKTGKTKSGANRSAKTIHGGAAFIWPVIQNYSFLDLTPISLEVNLTNALSRQNIRIDVPSRFTVGISTEPGVMTNAAERLLGLQLGQIQELAKDIIFGQLRLIVATMDIEEINTDRDKFLANVSQNVEAELQKIGLKLINVNVTDIRDESAYIEALGKEAAAKAINDAKKSVAEKNRDGSIGEAIAKQDERIQVAEANAKAVEGENTALISIAQTNAARREKEAEALKKAVAAEKVQSAKALEESYHAERLAETSRSERERATKVADVVVPAEIDKRKIEIDSEAIAEQKRRIAKGEADAIVARKTAEATGIYEVLTKQADGFTKLVEAAKDNSRDAVLLMIADKLPEIVKTQVEAIKNLKIDKVTVWDSQSGDGKTPAAANFLSGMLKSLPPMDEIFRMAGMELPDYLKGKKIEEGEQIKDDTDKNPEDSKE